MKKLSIIIVLVCAIVLGGCSSAGGGIGFDDVLPWSKTDKRFEETCTYDVIRYLGDSAAEGAFVITDSSSRVIYTLKEGRSVAPTGMDEIPAPVEISDPSCILLTMDLYVRYKNVEGVPDEYRPTDLLNPEPVEDTIKSWTVFDRNDLTAKFTKRIVDTRLGGRLSKTTLLADYTGGFYEDGNGKPVALLKDANGDVAQMKIKSGNYYDNEYIFYLVRALSTIKNDSSKDFRFSQPYDDFLEEKSSVSKRGLRQSTQKGTVLLPAGGKTGDIGAKVCDLFDIDPLEENAAIESFKTSLTLTASRSGSPVELYFAKNLISVYNDGGYGGGVQDAANPSAKLLLKIMSRSYNRNGSVAYTQSFVLQKYTSRIL